MFLEPRLILGASLDCSGGKPRSPSEGRTALPEEASKDRSMVCLAPAASVSLVALVLNPSAETETS